MDDVGELPFPYEYEPEHKGPRVPGTAPRERADALLNAGLPATEKELEGQITELKGLISKMRGSNFVHQLQRKIEDLRAAQKADLSTARAVEGVLRLDVLKAAPQSLVRARNEGEVLLGRNVQFRRHELEEASKRINSHIDSVVRNLRTVRPQLHGNIDPKSLFLRVFNLAHWFFVQPYDMACQVDLATRWFEWDNLFAPKIKNQDLKRLAAVWDVRLPALEAYVTNLPETRRRMQNALDAARKAKEAVQQSLAKGAMGYRAALRYRGIGH